MTSSHPTKSNILPTSTISEKLYHPSSSQHSGTVPRPYLTPPALPGPSTKVHGKPCLQSRVTPLPSNQSPITRQAFGGEKSGKLALSPRPVDDMDIRWKLVGVCWAHVGISGEISCGEERGRCQDLPPMRGVESVGRRDDGIMLFLLAFQGE